MLSRERAARYKREQTQKVKARRELKKKIDALEKQKDELFHAWVFNKATDEGFVRKEALRVYLAEQSLQAQYDAI